MLFDVLVQLKRRPYPEIVDAQSRFAKLCAADWTEVKPLAHFVRPRVNLNSLHGYAGRPKGWGLEVVIDLGFKQFEGRRQSKPAYFLRTLTVRIRSPQLAMPKALLKILRPPVVRLARVINYPPGKVAKATIRHETPNRFVDQTPGRPLDALLLSASLA